jgi:hypothetical protein
LRNANLPAVVADGAAAFATAFAAGFLALLAVDFALVETDFLVVFAAALTAGFFFVVLVFALVVDVDLAMPIV